MQTSSKNEKFLVQKEEAGQRSKINRAWERPATTGWMTRKCCPMHPRKVLGKEEHVSRS